MWGQGERPGRAEAEVDQATQTGVLRVAQIPMWSWYQDSIGSYFRNSSGLATTPRNSNIEAVSESLNSHFVEELAVMAVRRSH